MRRLVRPHLHTGDALLFDCRILHFGLSNDTRLTPNLNLVDNNNNNNDSKNNNSDNISANSSNINTENNSESLRRPIVYVNYHHKWFNDPKNWNDNERLFK